MDTGALTVDQDDAESICGLRARFISDCTQNVVGYVRVFNKNLGAVEDVIIAVVGDFCADTILPVPCAGFGQSQGKDHITVGEPRQQFSFFGFLFKKNPSRMNAPLLPTSSFAILIG